MSLNNITENSFSTNNNNNNIKTIKITKPVSKRINTGADTAEQNRKPRVKQNQRMLDNLDVEDMKRKAKAFLDPSNFEEPCVTPKGYQETKKPLPKKGDNSEYLAIKNERRRDRDLQKTMALESQQALLEDYAALNQRYAKELEDREKARKEMLVKKAARRRAYKKRHARDLHLASLHNSRNVMTLNVRVNLWAKYHKCAHGYGFNRVLKAPEEYPDQDYTFYCDHDYCQITLIKYGMQCQSCGSQNDKKGYNPHCKCHYEICPKCKRHTYMYYDDQNSPYTLSHDKHVDQRKVDIFLTKDEVSLMNLQFTKDLTLQQPSKPAKKQLSARNFLRELQGKEELKYSQAAGAKLNRRRKEEPAEIVELESFPELPSAGVSENDIFKKPIISLKPKNPWRKPESTTVETIPEGGTLSSMTAPVTGAYNGVKVMLEKQKAKIMQVITDSTNSILQQTVSDNPIVTKTVELFKALKYGISVIFDYLHVINPLVLYRIYTRMKSPLSLIVHLGEAIYNLKSYEELARLRFIDYMRTTRTLDKIGEQDFGVLTTIIRGIWANTKEDQPTKVRKSLSCGLLYSTHELKQKEDKTGFVITKSEAGCCDFIHNLLSLFPKHFARSAKILTVFFKEYMPLLLGLKSIADLYKHLKTGVEYMMKAIMGYGMKPEEWLNVEMKTETSPVHELITIAAAYSAQPSGPYREMFYSKLAECDQHVETNKMYSTKWFSLRKSLGDFMQTPPTPCEREFEPTVLVLSGPPGLFKSTLWKPLVAQELVGQDSKDVIDDLMKMTHTWNAASEFQPGMSKAKIILMDDIGQDKGKPDQVLNFIALATSAPYPINSPNITGPEIKGCFCEPELVVLCTNADHKIIGQQVLDPGAVERRYDIDFTMTEKYDPNNPDKNIARVNLCTRYEGLKGKAVNFAQMKAIFSTVHRMKRKTFQQVKKDIRNLTDQAFTADLMKNLTDCKITSTKSDLWQLSEDFSKDYEAICLIPEVKKDEKGKAPKKQDDETPLKDDTTTKKEEPKKDDKTPEVKQTNSTYNLNGIFAQLIGNQNSDDEIDAIVTQKEAGTSDFLLKSISSILLNGAVITVPIGAAIGVLQLTRQLYYSSILIWHGHIYQGIYDLVKSVFKIIIGGAIALGTSLLIFKTFTTDTNDESGGTRTAKTKNIQTVMEAGETDDKIHLLKRATGAIKDMTTSVLVNVIFVGGHYILAPRHFFLDLTTGSYFENGRQLQLVKSTWTIFKTIIFDIKNLVLMKGNVDQDILNIPFREDVCLYKLDKRDFSAEKSIVKYFWDGTQSLLSRRVEKIDFLPFNLDGSYRGEFSFYSGDVTGERMRTFRTEDGNTKVYHVFAEASYDPRSSSCGSIVRQMYGDREILGIHVARGGLGGTQAYFHYVTRTALENAMREVIVPEEPFNVKTLPENGIPFLPERTTLQYQGTCKSIYQPIQTDLRPSLVYDFLHSHITEPAALSCYDSRLPEAFKTRDAFKKQMYAGYVEQDNQLNAAALKLAYKSLVDDYRKIEKKSLVSSKRLTLHEALNGIPEIEGNTRIDMTASTGYPYIQAGIQRKDLIDDVDGVLIPRQRLVDDYNHAMKLISEGTIPFLPFTLSYKDERLKLKKIYQEPKTRVFSCGNIVHLLVMRTFFYTTLMQYYHAKLQDTFCVPKLDRLSLDWHDLSIHMLSVGCKGFDFDFTFWDKTITHSMLYYGTKILLTGMQVSRKEKLTLLELMSSPYCVTDSMVFRTNGTMMSGCLLTYLLNCVINEMLHRAAWIDIMKERRPMLCEIRHYKEYTRGIRGGDDTFTTVDDRVLEEYNGETVSSWMLSHGMLVTSASKSHVIPKFSLYDKLLFLKNTTANANGFFIPQPEKESLIESMYWIRLSKYNQDPLKATQDNVICSLRGIFFYGKQYYDYVRSEVLLVEPRLQLPSYAELSIIWNKFFKFPGSNADYATRELQIDPFITDVRPHHIRQNTSVQMDFDHNMNAITTYFESGVAPLDKAKLEDNSIKATTSDETSTSPPSQINNEDMGDPQKSEKENVGATIQDSTTQAHLSMTVGKSKVSSKNDRAAAYLNDVDWDLTKIEQKFTYVKDVDWQTTQTIGTFLTTLEIPKDILVTPAQKTPFDVTNFWKCETIIMKLVLKSSPFYAGSLGLGFTPLGYTPDWKRMINMGALIQKASQDESIEFNISFRFPLGYLDVAKDTLGTFHIFVISPLRTGANNPSSVTMTLYTSIIGSHFKLPTIVDSAFYHSKKLDPPAMIVRTIPESGTQHAITLCDINSPLSEMDKVTLCAGQGTLGKVRVPHFQDAPDDLVQLGKRYRLVSRGQVTVGEKGELHITYDLDALVRVAAHLVSKQYAIWRGSINVRFILRTPGVSGSVGLIIPNNASPTIGTTNGIHWFDYDTPALINVPWTKSAFVDYFSGALNKPYQYLELILYNYSNSVVEKAIIEMYVAVGDDFHCGIYLGNGGIYVNPEDRKIDPISVAATGLVTTFAESGILEFIDRALETTVPIAEAVSEIGSLLDAHQITYQPYPIQPRKIPFQIATDNVQYIERLYTTNHNGLSLPDKHCFGTATHETSISNLLINTKSYDRSVTWGANMATGTNLVTLFSGPNIPTNAPNLHGNLPSLFTYWTGGTTYIFDIIATEQHRGQLIFTFNTVFEDFSYVDATQTYFASYDLSKGRGTMAIELPYLSNRPYHRTPQLGDTIDDSMSTGILKVFVQNPLRSVSTVASDVEIVVYKTFSKDFQLGLYGSDASFAPL